MKKILTKWTTINYRRESYDFSWLFSEEVDEGWEIQSISTAVDTYMGESIFVITALLTK